MKSVRWALIELDNICLHYDRVNPTADLGELYDLGVRNHHLNAGGMERLARWLKDNSVIYPLLYLPRLNPASMFADRQQINSDRTWIHDVYGCHDSRKY